MRDYKRTHELDKKIKNQMEVCEYHLARESLALLKPPQENPVGQNPR